MIKKQMKFTLFLILLFGMVVVVGCDGSSSSQSLPPTLKPTKVAEEVSPTAENTPTVEPVSISSESPSPELIHFVALTAVAEQVKNAESGYDSPEGSIIAYLSESGTPLQVWTYEEGGLIETEIQAYERAKGNNSNNWPPYTYGFKFDSIESERVEVTLSIHYDSGISANSRGGYRERLVFRIPIDTWELLYRKTLERWD